MCGEKKNLGIENNTMKCCDDTDDNFLDAIEENADTHRVRLRKEI